MSKNNITAEPETATDIDDELEGIDDYGFIIGPNGELKHMFAPDEFDLDPPAVVRKILKLFGIKDINAGWDQDTLH